MDRTHKIALCSLVFNMAFSAYYLGVGILSKSWWLLTLGAYYLILSVVRFLVLRINKCKQSLTKSVGIMLLVLSLPFAGTVILAASKDRGQQLHEILMITMALYAFSKITLATVNLIKARNSYSAKLITLRNISFADAFVSIFALQRSMLVSFGEMSTSNTQLFNILTGTAVWIIVLLLGINLIGGKTITMAKSKIVKANEKIAEAVTHGYKKIEKGVVDGYRKIEQGVVGGYTKLEDKFVDAYLTQNGESIEEAKARLKKEKK